MPDEEGSERQVPVNLRAQKLPCGEENITLGNFVLTLRDLARLTLATDCTHGMAARTVTRASL
jgi:hypothetical protein